MPILDPSTMVSLIIDASTDEKDKKKKTSKIFFFKYLRIASRNIFYNADTVQTSMKFKKDLHKYIFLNRSAQTNINYLNIFQNDFQNSAIKDFYRYLFEKINLNYPEQQCFKKARLALKGEYLSNSKYRFFKIRNSKSNKGYHIYLSNTPIAVICLDLIQNPDLNLFYINLELDLLQGSGYLIVLCIHMSVSSKFRQEMLIFISQSKYAEIHIILENENRSKKDSEILYSALCNITIQSHLYLYFQYFEISEKVNEYYKILKKKQFFHSIHFSFDVIQSIKHDPLKKADKFFYCKNGFEYDKIQICLSNVPLYKELNDSIPKESSSFSIALINKNDFLYRYQERNKIYIYLIEVNLILECQYINHDDLYAIKPEYYVMKMLYLTKTDASTLDIITMMQDQLSSKNSNTDEFKKEFIFSLFKEKKVQQVLIYVSYAYSKYIYNSANKKFRLHDNQLFTGLEACKSCLFDSSKLTDDYDSSKGVIYQVDTGEGKSCIICLIASLLALMKKTVHIASSNITLANRDYHDSFLFFQQLGLKSAVLLHYNELPINDDKNDSETNDYKYNPNFYPQEFFRKSLFKNSSNMNFSVCGIGNDNEIVKNKANVVFSTFVNFESLYLRIMETFPAYLNTYYKDCSLLIDEADSILIDELSNGTILSRSLKTNGDEILEFVYKSWLQKKPQEITFKEVKSKWLKCTDLSLDDINDMYNQIDLVNQDEFKNGIKYSIESIEIREKITLDSIIQNSTNLIKDMKEKVKGSIQKVFSFKNIDKNVKDNRKSKTYKYIVPFDYDNKGILEPNKEFSGFIHQFIAIKEKLSNEENQNLKIKEASLNYLYVSHPIFVSCYDGVCGLTGTIGNKYNKKIYKEQYNLITKKIPRNLPNYLVEYPIILCDSIEERNNKIVYEAISLTKKKIPVMAIFQDLNEISAVFNILISKGVNNVFIFDGINNKIKPDSIAGDKGTISLGTNVCGRGTNIKVSDFPLHVIVAYFTSNSRVMHQAFGRTARQGNPGSVRIICLKKQYISPIRILNDSSISNYLDDFQFKNNIQRKFIERYRAKRSWIFSGPINPQKLTDEVVAKLRKAKINVNRIRAFEFEFPICMSYQTFLDIQSQRIFSLFNCPNCKYTWMLFQKYVREMILESWSLFIEKIDKQFNSSQKKGKYKDCMNKEIGDLYKILDFYLPEKKYEIVPTFMHIFKIVLKKYEEKIMSLYPKDISKCLKQVGRKRFCSFTIGFKPYSLINESGARINSIDGKDQKQTYIKDPELKYIQKLPDHYYSILSITEKIDGIFNVICQKINDLIGSYIGLKFFLRRTLGGCEFGVCFDFDIENIDGKILSNENCLIDTDPLFLFTISVKSMVPILAGILIIGLVYIASVAKSLFEWVANFSGKALVEIMKKTLKEIASKIIDSQISKFCDSICTFLSSKLAKQDEVMKKYKQELAKFFNLLLKIVSPADFAFSGDTIKSLFNNKINVNMNFSGVLADNIPVQQFLKIGFLLMLCFASFMMNFHFHRQAIKYDSLKVSSEYDENQNVDDALNQNAYTVKDDKINDNSKFDFKK